MCTPDLHVPPASPNIAVSGSRGLLALSDSHLSVPGSSPSASSPISAASCFPSFSENAGDGLSPQSQSPGTLDATELGLLSHYLTNTSRAIPFDDVDLYSLSVGVPNLAFNSKPIMSSLLALSAASKCHDIARQAQNPLDARTRVEMQGLLTLAEHHHGVSLRHIQAAVNNSDWYDNVLINAALMVLYTSASHAIRVHLAATAQRSGQQLPSDMLPQHSQWMSFISAAHTASAAVLRTITNTAAGGQAPAITTPMHPPPESPRETPSRTNVLSPQDGPNENTRRLFLPVVSSTCSRALESLRKRAESTASIFNTPEFSACSSLELQACLDALRVLEKRASAALSIGEAGGNEGALADEAVSFDGHSRVSPWVRRYMASVTSMASPRALRRIIMSFLSQAPVGYLNLIQSVLDLPSAEVSSGSWMVGDSPGTEAPSLSATHLLAMDIFAHWLVLVMLLDGVWWIGGIGQWELGQVVPLIKSQNWLDHWADAGGTWWPESMYLVKRELADD